MTVMYLYLLENNKNKIFYIGLTNNVNRRLEEHNKKSKHFTGKMSGNLEIIGTKEFNDEDLARSEEKRLKKSKNKKYVKWYFKIG